MIKYKYPKRAGFRNKFTKSTHVRRVMLACRKRMNLSLRAVADLVGISEGYYRKIENGQCTPSIHVFMDIAKVLGVDWRDIVEVQEVEKDD